MTAGQLDLLALLDPEPVVIDDPQETHSALFRRVWFRAAYDTSFDKAGDRRLGWQCPACRGIEWNAALMSINHAIDPEDPGSGRWLLEEGICGRILLRRNQEGYGDATGPAGAVACDELDVAADAEGVVRLAPGEFTPSTDRVVQGFGVCACGCSVLHHGPPPTGRHSGPLGACVWCSRCRECRAGATAR